MKKRMLALLLLASLTAGLCAAAAGTEGVNPEGDVILPAAEGVDPEAAPPQNEPAAPAQDKAAADAGNPPDAPSASAAPSAGVRAAAQPPAAGQETIGAGAPPSTAQTITFYGIDSTVRKNNLSLQVLDQSMRGLESTDVEMKFFLQYAALDLTAEGYRQQIETIRGQIDQFEAIPGDDPAITGLKNAMLKYLRDNLAAAQGALNGIPNQRKQLEEAEEDAQDEIDDAVYTTRKTAENLANTLVSSAESLYISIAAQQLGLADLQSQLAALDRNIVVAEITYRQGNMAQLELEQLKNGRAQMMSGIQSMAFGIDTMKGQLGLLLGWEPGVKPAVSGLTPVSDALLRSMNYENDLKEALKNSYTVWQKKDALRQANNDYEDDVTSTLHAVNAAKLDQQSAERSVTQAFRTLCDTVLEKRRLVGVAQTDYELQVKLFNAEDKKYELGKISKNDLAAAQDTLDKAKNAVTAAQYELFTAFNQYEWAKKGLTGS